jgi:hypothetical protein
LRGGGTPKHTLPGKQTGMKDRYERAGHDRKRRGGAQCIDQREATRGVLPGLLARDQGWTRQGLDSRRGKRALQKGPPTDTSAAAATEAANTARTTQRINMGNATSDNNTAEQRTTADNKAAAEADAR